jgi:kumamolisin
MNRIYSFVQNWTKTARRGSKRSLWLWLKHTSASNAFVAVALSLASSAHGQVIGGQTTRLQGHIPSALSSATRLPRTPQAAAAPLRLTVVLSLSDQAGFDAFMQALDDPASPNYHQTLSPEEMTTRFGPSQEAYDRVRTYLEQNGFTIVEGSANRLTLAARGTRAHAEQTFGLSIDDYKLEGGDFFANDNDPAVPNTLAPMIRSISGLSNLARPQWGATYNPATPMSIATTYNGSLRNVTGGLPPGLNGTGQTIGLIEFDNYFDSDVSNWLSQVGLSPYLMDQLHRVNIGGGVTPSSGCRPLTPQSPSCSSTEVLLDIDAVLGIAPGANIMVFVGHAEPNGSNYAFTISDYLSVINGAINQVGRGGTLSTSFGFCERSPTNTEADNMEFMLSWAAGSGITLFAYSGDTGANGCKAFSGTTDSQRVNFPADAPHAVAVGGTTLQVGPNNSYQNESWWNDGNGSGGFGYSWHFQLPSWQAPFTNAPGRSVPDVAAEAGDGILVCEGTLNGSPSCQVQVGTSLATPLWAGIWALASQAAADAGHTPTSASGSFLYGLGNNDFHTASSMTGAGNDFSHVGLGSPNITNLVADVAGPPEITSISPSFGPITGGTEITINGKGFIGVENVYIARVPATNFQVRSDTQITAFSPGGKDAASVFISVVTPVGSSPWTNAGLYQYLPVVESVAPSTGPLEGGTNVRVTGIGFHVSPLDHFYFGSTPANNVQCTNEGTGDMLVGGNVYRITACTMSSPAHRAGTVHVTAGTATQPGVPNAGDQFAYAGPLIFGISPAFGPTYGGTHVILYGHGLAGNMTVRFGNLTADPKTLSCNNDGTQCNVDSPVYWSPYPCCAALAIAGPGALREPVVAGVSGASVASLPVPAPPQDVATVPVTATLSNITSPPMVTFSYAIYPAIFNVSGQYGPSSGGTNVSVTGNYFSTAPGATTFSFGSSQATNVICSSPTFCTMTLPLRTDPTLNVIVTATVNGNTSQPPMNGSYTYGSITTSF